MFDQVNELAILASALLAVAVGSIWYSPLLFGSAWMKSIGRDERDLEQPKLELYRATLWSVVVESLFLFILVQLFILTENESLQLVKFCGLMTLAVGLYTMVLGIKEQRSFAYVVIHVGYRAIVIFGGLAVITYWPW